MRRSIGSIREGIGWTRLGDDLLGPGNIQKGQCIFYIHSS